jgi:hypothetical protein
MKEILSPLATRFVPASSSTREVTMPKGLRHKESGVQIPAGTAAVVTFGTLDGAWFLRATIETAEARIVMFTRRVTAFFTPPALDEICEDESGTAYSVLGETVEPDGIDPEGSPSWLLALGLI